MASHIVCLWEGHTGTDQREVSGVSQIMNVSTVELIQRKHRELVIASFHSVS